MTKDELIEEHRDINVDYRGWWEFTYEDFIERLAEAGITVTTSDISFSGFWSQGDGAQFSMSNHTLLELVEGAQKWMVKQWPDYEGKGEDGKDAGGPIIEALHSYCVALLEEHEVKLLGGELRAVMDGVEVACKVDGGHYCHSGYMKAEIDAGYDVDVTDEQVREIEQLFTEYLRALADALYETLEEEYNYQTADEQVWDAIVANGLDEELTQDEEDEEPCNG